MQLITDVLYAAIQLYSNRIIVGIMKPFRKCEVTVKEYNWSRYRITK